MSAAPLDGRQLVVRGDRGTSATSGGDVINPPISGVGVPELSPLTTSARAQHIWYERSKRRQYLKVKLAAFIPPLARQTIDHIHIYYFDLAALIIYSRSGRDNLQAMSCCSTPHMKGSRRNARGYRKYGWLGMWLERRRAMRARMEARLAVMAAKRILELREKTQGAKDSVEGDDDMTGTAPILPVLPRLVKPVTLVDRDSRSLFHRTTKYDNSSDEEELVYDLDDYNKKRLETYERKVQERLDAGYKMEDIVAKA